LLTDECKLLCLMPKFGVKCFLYFKAKADKFCVGDLPGLPFNRIRFFCSHFLSGYNSVMVFAPTVKFIAPEALRLFTAVPFTVIVALASLLVG